MECQTRDPCSHDLSEKQIGSKSAISFLGLLLLSMLSAGYGAEQETDAVESPAMPDLEFLEFLGQFETEEEEWIDPGSLLAEEFTDLLDATLATEPDSTDSGDARPGNAGNDTGN